MSKQIWLGGKHGSIIGNYAIVDDEDYEELNKYKWFVIKYDYKMQPAYYVKRNNKYRQKPRSIRMHRQVMNIINDSELQVDHINHNGLDNRKENLRLCTEIQNKANYRNRIHPVSNCNYKGVSKDRKGQYRSYIMQNYRQICLGTYKTAEEAATAHDIKALELHGEFAYLNFPEKDYVNIIPPTRLDKKLPSTGHRNISYSNKDKRYIVKIPNLSQKAFKELDAAIKYRNKIWKVNE